MDNLNGGVQVQLTPEVIAADSNGRDLEGADISCAELRGHERCLPNGDLDPARFGRQLWCGGVRRHSSPRQVITFINCSVDHLARVRTIWLEWLRAGPVGGISSNDLNNAGRHGNVDPETEPRLP